MECSCTKKDVMKGNEATCYTEKFLECLKVDANKWRTLYKCKYCNTHWEERVQDERFTGIPILQRLD